jgi:hypothetical protein
MGIDNGQLLVGSDIQGIILLDKIKNALSQKP